MNALTGLVTAVPGQSNTRCRRARLWLLLCFVIVIACTLAPFDSLVPRNQVLPRLAQTLEVEITPAELIGHCLSFFALGIFVANAYARTLRIAHVAAIVLGALLFCGGLEFAQLFQPARHARVNDVAVNTFSLTAGIFLTARAGIGVRWREALQRAAGRPLYFETFMVVAILVVWWVIGLQPAFGALRMNWDPSFPLTVGNETGGARPWLGQMQYLGIYDRALSKTDVQNFQQTVTQKQNSEIRSHFGLLVGYDFRDALSGKEEYAGSLKDQKLCLTVPAEWMSPSGLTISRTGLAQSHGPATKMVEAIERSGAFSIEVVMDPQNLHEIGPARVVSNSLGPGKRNFTLGQSEANLVFRVRNNVNSENGNLHELIAPHVIEADRQHIVATYDHGVSTLFKNGNRCATVDLREPIFYSGLANSAFARAALVSLAVLAISLPTWFIFERSFSIGRPLAAAVSFTTVGVLSPYLISCWMVGGPFRFSFMVFYVVAFLVLFPVTLRFVSTCSDAPA